MESYEVEDFRTYDCKIGEWDPDDMPCNEDPTPSDQTIHMRVCYKEHYHHLPQKHRDNKRSTYTNTDTYDFSNISFYSIKDAINVILSIILNFPQKIENT